MLNKVLKEYGTMKITAISPNFLEWKFIFYISFKFKGFNIFIKQCYLISQSVKKNTEEKPERVAKTNKEKPMLSSNCSVCNRRKIKIYQSRRI